MELRLAILLGVEAAKVLTDDFVAGVALDALGTRVPGCYAPGWIQLENGVVDNRFNKAPVALLAFKQVPMGFLPLSDVARDFGESEEFAILIPNGIQHHGRPKSRAVLSHAPPFTGKTPCFPGGGQRFTGQAGSLIFRGVKFGK